MCFSRLEESSEARGAGNEGGRRPPFIMAAMTNERFRALVEEYQTQVYNLALRMMREPAAAEDVCQEAFISAYRAFSSFRGENPKAWLMRIATNTCYDFLRRSARRPTVSYDDEDHPLPDPLPSRERGSQPEESALARERERVISALPLNTRSVLCF